MFPEYRLVRHDFKIAQAFAIYFLRVYSNFRDVNPQFIMQRFFQRNNLITKSAILHHLSFQSMKKITLYTCYKRTCRFLLLVAQPKKRYKKDTQSIRVKGFLEAFLQFKIKRTYLLGQSILKVNKFPNKYLLSSLRLCHD